MVGELGGPARGGAALHHAGWQVACPHTMVAAWGAGMAGGWATQRWLLCDVTPALAAM